MNKTIEIDQQIQQEGAIAYREGRSRTDNPYIGTLFKQSAWAIGWDNAKTRKYDIDLETNNIRYILGRLERREILSGSKGMQIISGTIRGLGYKAEILKVDEVIVFLKNQLETRGGGKS